MSFFKKLKDKLFKSSSKIEEGLDAIVDDGGTAEEIETEVIEEQAAEAGAEQAAEAERVAEEARVEVERAAEAERLAEQARIAAEKAAAEQAEQAAAEQAEKAARLAAEEAAKQAAEIARVEAEKVAEAAAQKAAQAAAQKVEAAERAKLESEAAEAARQAEVAQHAEAARQAEAKREHDAREQTARQDAKRQEDLAEAKRQEEARAEAARQDAARTKAALEAAQAAQEAQEAAQAEKAAQEAQKPGLIGRLLGRTEKKTVVRRELDDDMLERLEELLISADMGVDTALRVTANMAEGRFGKRLSSHEIKELLAAEITRIMEPVARPMPLYPKKPQVVLVVGVNGSGKTTTIGKLASQFRAAGKSVVIAAGDTFRAAAVEQLQVWGDRAGVPVLTAPEGSDPASLAFDAMEKAAADGADLLMIDTAGRLQNRADLMEELSKIVRVIRKKDPDAPHNTLLVLDATTGQNALNQVKVFQELADVSGLVMTKLDGTAKGGVLVALADKFGLPIHAIGVGEQIDDLSPFDPQEFAAALTGLEP